MFKIFLLLFLAATPTDSVRFTLTGLECQVVDPKFCAFENCIIKPVSRGIKEINGKIILLQVPVNNISIRLQLTRRGYIKHMLYAVDIDGCRFWIGKRRNPFASSIYKSLRLDVFTNINHSCPYNHDLIVNHLRLDENLNLNLPIAVGEYVIKLHWKVHNVLRAIISWNFQIE
ncbi:uncharacterized protein [Drosophila virilis]|uniref:MD-2-related lipid-recognition domain-containing protein n=1 Tax=Drosophila virilis TaxID=7244 RepID=B4MFE4_DROVI|nr:uncharacterized protein LOC6636425 isoform X2 [Drosophila virilis]EDW57313.2 uncharacterized protein Dvir_GJ14943 [Drosophila virilis]